MAKPGTTRPRDSSGATTARRLDGWGFDGESVEPSGEMLAWLARCFEPGPAFPRFDPDQLGKMSEPGNTPLPDLGGEISRDLRDRLAHSRGRGFSDLVRLRSGSVPRLCDAVARPADDDELESLLRNAAAAELRVIPWGGGTSVTGGVNVLDDPRPVVTLDLERLSGLEALDPVSRLATLGAGTPGPAVEAALAPHGLTLGHFPQSWELSTVGGWVATRSAGQESLGSGRIESLVAGLDLVAPGGRLHLPTLPASAAGPDLRHLALGSEGRFGVIPRAVLRVRPKPERFAVVAALAPSWEQGVEAARDLVQQGTPLALLRLSDGPETEVAMAIGLAKSRFAALVRGYLRLRGIGQGMALMLLGASGGEAQVERTLDQALDRLRRHRVVSLGEGPGRHWIADRFRHPYLRDSLFDHGIATDTFETAVPWSGIEHMVTTVRRALEGAVAEGERRIPVLCHLSHPYRDGASLYFTFFFRCPPDPDAAIERWADLKRRATRAVVDGGGTLSHHHGIGSWHAPWYPEEAGEMGVRVLRSMAKELDPKQTLVPGVLLDPEDRLTL